MRKEEFKSSASIEKEEKELLKKDRSSDIIELLKNTLIMFLITLVAGGVLGFVFELTKGPIAEMEGNTVADSNKTVFSLAESFMEYGVDEAVLSLVKEEYGKVDITDCLQALDADGNLLGYVISVTSHEGYGGDISFTMGVSLDGTLYGISITAISETAGLGMRAEEVLVPQFKNKQVTSFELSKGTEYSDNQIDAITSATITSKAVTKGVNAGLSYFRNIISGGALNE